MNKPMKKYVNGVLNQKYISQNKSKSFERVNFNEDLASLINKKADEKKIHDSRLDDIKEKSEKELREDTNQKVEKAKELLGIRETNNKKNDTLDNYKKDYRKRHEIRDFKEKSNINDNKINYNDIFKDL